MILIRDHVTSPSLSMSRCNKEFREVPFFVKLHKELNNPTNMHNFGSVDRIMLGLCSDTVARRDEYLTDELTNHLFQVCIFNRLVQGSFI